MPYPAGNQLTARPTRAGQRGTTDRTNSNLSLVEEKLAVQAWPWAVHQPPTLCAAEARK